jgi:hypothetical protein
MGVSSCVARNGDTKKSGQDNRQPESWKTTDRISMMTSSWRRFSYREITFAGKATGEESCFLQ